MKEPPFSGEHISGPEKVVLLVIAVGVIVLIGAFLYTMVTTPNK
jgi:cell division protein FtsL